MVSRYSEFMDELNLLNPTSGDIWLTQKSDLNFYTIACF